MTTYAEFLARKARSTPTLGRPCTVDEVNTSLFGFQRHVTAWAVSKGRAACWATTGMGKSRMQVEWCRLSADRALIVAPLAVCQQTIREAAAIGVPAAYARNDGEAAGPGLWVTNYERIEAFNPADLGAVALDEASILKQSTGRTRTMLIRHFAAVPRRTTWTATPAPNDIEELTNQAAFLGVMPRQEMLAAYFIHDEAGWRLKGHARRPMFRWMTSWAVALRKPSDLGYPDDGYDLPPLSIIPELVESDVASDEALFATLGGVSERARIRRETLAARCNRAISLVLAEADEQWVVWCDLNAEATRIAAAIPGAVNVHGSLTPEDKAAAFLDFADGGFRVLVTKPSIAAMGLNLQGCARMAFVGLSDCYDDQTEVLTREGWKTFGKVSSDDDLATVHPQSHTFEWQAPSRVVWEPYSGPMLHFHGQRNFDLLVTPNHKLYTQRCPIRFPGDQSGWQLRYATDIADRFRRSEHRMMSAPPFANGALPEWVEVPPFGRLNPRSRTVTRIAAEDFVRLAGWYLSEGYCRPIDSNERGRIVLCQSAQHPEYRDEIITLMGRLGLNVNCRSKDITGYSLNLAAYLIDQFGSGSYEKRIPRWVKDLHPSLLRILRDTMMKGDGASSGAYYKSISPGLRDDFQEICLRTGVRASVHGDYVSLAWERTRPAIWREPDRVHYDGMVGCATVPNHTLIVRRNGIPVVSGNSYERYFQGIRRCWRFGQPRPVHAHVILSDIEAGIATNIRRKEAEAEAMMAELVAEMRAAGQATEVAA